MAYVVPSRGSAHHRPTICRYMARDAPPHLLFPAATRFARWGCQLLMTFRVVAHIGHTLTEDVDPDV